MVENTLLASNGFSRFALALVGSVLCPTKDVTNEASQTQPHRAGFNS
jgi:hypothetical protein